MAVGEFIAELLLKDLVGTVLCGIGYGTGMVVLKLLTFGKIPIAPFGTLHERRPKSRWWQDWGPWFHQSQHRKVLKADYACLAGLLVWVIAGIAAYQAFHQPESKETSVSVRSEKLYVQLPDRHPLGV